MLRTGILLVMRVGLRVVKLVYGYGMSGGAVGVGGWK